MDEKLKTLRQQVAAAEFLLRNLQQQLLEAEEQAAKQRGESRPDSQRDATSSHIRPGVPSGNNLEGQGSRLSVTAAGEEAQPQPEAKSNPHAGAGDHGIVEDENEDAPGEADTEVPPAFQLPSIEVGAIYPSLEDIKKAVTAHAISQGWTSRVYKRDRTRLLMRCRTSDDCPFHLRAEQYTRGAKICALKPEHSCNFQADQGHVIRSHAANLKFLRQELPTFMTVTDKTTAKEISEAIFNRFGTRVSTKQCRHLKVTPKRKRTITIGTCSTCGGAGHNRLTCGRDVEQALTPSDA
jgi:hypothetical protein